MENEMQEDRNEGPPRKRLLADPNPKESCVTASPESTVSTDSSSDRIAKKTRELPNLSDCHSCAVRINYTNPRERLQPLDSMWRVVLLCKNCTKRVKSSELCPYCFSSVDENDCFKCRDCHHSIHKDCVAKYGSGLGFSVCVDCWVPDAVANSIRMRRRKSRKRNKESCEPAVTLPDSKVSVPKTNEPNLLGQEVERKVAAAAKASENAIRKAVAAKNAVELAKGVLSVVASTKVAGNRETKDVDDAELAFMLHRAINSSPRISRYACLVSSYSGDNAQITCYSRRLVLKNDSGSLDIPLVCYSRRRKKGGMMDSTSLDAPLVCYARRRSTSKAYSYVRECVNCKPSERIDKHVSISSAGLEACDRGCKSSLNGNECQEHDGGCDMKPHHYTLKYHRIGKGIPRPSVFFKDSDVGSCMDSGNLNTEAMSDPTNFGNGKECHDIGEERCNENANRFLLKYEKRSVRSKPYFSYRTEDSAPLLPSNCLKQSMSSATRFQSSYEAFACPGASSQGEL